MIMKTYLNDYYRVKKIKPNKILKFKLKEHGNGRKHAKKGR